MLVLTIFHLICVNHDFVGEIILESMILKSAVVVSLTVYTFGLKSTLMISVVRDYTGNNFCLAVVIIVIFFALVQVSNI